MTSGYKFPILNSDGSASSTAVDFDDMFVPKDAFLNASLWDMGDNSNANLGNGNTINASSPIQIGSMTNWKMIASGNYHSIAIKTDGTLWSWGQNPQGQLGQNVGIVTNASTPVQVGSLTNWKYVSAGQTFSFAIKTDGTLWGWGGNSSAGQLGDGTTINRSSPVQIGTMTNWKQIAGFNLGAVAIKTDGTLWSWGQGTSLGSGATTPRSSPLQVGTLTNWKTISGSPRDYGILAVKTDGTLWGWGISNVGDGTVFAKSSPVQIGTMTNWKQPYMANVGTSLYATKTDGTLWSWGIQSSGSLGVPTSATTSSPIQIGSMTNWKMLAAGTYHVAAIKTDGTLWAWGSNTLGALGDGTTVNKSSPIQVGSLANWKFVNAGKTSIFLIQSSDFYTY